MKQVKQKIKILYVVNELAYFISHRLVLAKAAQVAGYEIHVAAPPGQNKDDLVAHGFIYHSIPLGRRSLNIFSELKTFLSLLALYKKLNPDLVHHLTIKPIVYGGIAARLLKIGAVVNALTGLGYVFTGKSPKTQLLAYFVKKAYRFALKLKNGYVIFQNKDDFSLFLSLYLVEENKAILIRGSGVDVHHFVPLPFPNKNMPIVVLASRLLKDKGVLEFIEAAKSLKNKGVSARFVLVGDVDPGNPSSFKAKELEEYVKQGAIEWWGKSNAMLEIFKQCHIVCLPSYREGLPKVLLEAASCARPIVTTDAPGCREIVANGKNGFLVPVADSIELAKSLEVLIENAELMQLMGKAGREMVEKHFSNEVVINKTLEVYSALTESICQNNNLNQ